MVSLSVNLVGNVSLIMRIFTTFLLPELDLQPMG